MENIDNGEAYRYFLEALHINEALEDHYNSGKVYLRLSHLERNSMNFEKCLIYTRQAIQAFAKQPKRKGLAMGYMEAGIVFYDLVFEYPLSVDPAYPDSALSYFHKAEKIFLMEDKTMEIARISYMQGKLYTLRRDPRAISYLYRSLNAWKQVGKDSAIFGNELSVAEAWLMLNKYEKFKEAIGVPEKRVKQGDFVTPHNLTRYHKIYADYYKSLGDWENALVHTEKGMAYREKVNESNRLDNVNLWRVKLEMHQKDAELQLRQERINSKQKRIEQQHIYMSVLSLFFILLIILSFSLYKNFRKQKKLSLKNEILIHEQNHRVKNNLQVISSLLNLQADYIGDVAVQKALTESQTRINSMLLLHKQLYENDNIENINMRELLMDLSSSIAHSFGVYTLQLNLSMEAEYLKTDVATAVGLIFNELITNSFKHVFTEAAPPRIEVIATPGKNDMITMKYLDFGDKDLTQIIAHPNKKTFGLNLVEMILIQINGKMGYSFQNGSVFTIQFKNI